MAAFEDLPNDELDDSEIRKTSHIASESASSPERREHGDAIRTELLEAVRKRLESGYYDSDRVLDDLSDSFAQALDQSL